MNSSTLMHNAYNPYGDFNSDIANIVETEKKINEDRVNEYNEKRSKLLPLKGPKGNQEIDYNHIFEQITFVLNETFEDVFNRNAYRDVFKKDRWVGIGYIMIIIYICYYVSKF